MRLIADDSREMLNSYGADLSSLLCAITKIRSSVYPVRRTPSETTIRSSALQYRRAFDAQVLGAENNANTGEDSRTRLIRLNEQLANKLFGPSSQALDVEPVELLHAAILFSFVRTFPQRPAPCIFGEANGRETWDASIDARRAMEMHGWKHFTSIYHNTKQERCSAGTHLMEITFNYAGKFQQVEQDGAVFRMEPIAKQNLFDGAGKLGRWAMLEINSVILNGMLEFHVTYSRGTDEARVLTPWMDTLVKCLEDLARGYASMVDSESFILE
ncbi:nonribosomal peptide syntethase 9 [Aspergillus udagawae]|nr:nonribosomal peptide syntethase 9 [Aspergillus udagawae]